LDRKKPDKVTFEREGDIVVVGLGVNEVKVTKNTYNLYQDAEIRRAADKIVAPLHSEGIEVLEIKRGNEVETVTKPEAPAFQYSELEGELLLDQIAEAWLTIISLSFKPEHKWRFNTGASMFSANVMDEEFWDRVHKHIIKFSEGDQLLVNLRTATARDEQGILRTRYTVEKVLKHVSALKQHRLPL